MIPARLLQRPLQTGRTYVAGKVRHLLERSGRFYARVSVPPTLRAVVGQRELTAALGGDRSTALRKLPGAVAGMLARLESARQDAQATRVQAPRLINGKRATPRELALAHYASQDAFDREL